MLRTFMRTRPLHSLLARYSSNTANGGGSLYNELVGSRAHIERKKAFFSEKYKDVIQRKAQQEGLPDVDSLRQKYQATRAAQEPTNPGARYSAKKDSRPSRDSSPAPSSQKSSSGPGIKPLSDILDLSKVADLNSQALANLWTAYHQEKGFLSAAIPISTYRTMVETAKKYPMFVLPLARETAEQEGAVEMHLTQWSFMSPSTTDSVPTSTVLFTGLAEYQARQEYAQPYLILTNYADLATSHGHVLMRGEVTPGSSLSPTDAQMLAFRLQNFYFTSENSNDPKELSRRGLLKTFHETPDKFDVSELVKMARTL